MDSGVEGLERRKPELATQIGVDEKARTRIAHVKAIGKETKNVEFTRRKTLYRSTILNTQQLIVVALRAF